nr:retrovirus-related Pol polyprotein from transposon TNT 1-94 [Tanacetum cinerariifolium]
RSHKYIGPPNEIKVSPDLWGPPPEEVFGLDLSYQITNQVWRSMRSVDNIFTITSTYSNNITTLAMFTTDHLTKEHPEYSKESSSKVVFGDNSSCDTEGYGSVNYNGITFIRVAYVNGLKHNSFSQLGDTNFKVLFTKTRVTIFNHNNEVFLIAPRRRDAYVIEMSSYNEESNTCFFAKASNSVNWLWHKRLSHLNFKNINKLSKQNLVAGLPSLTYSKDKPYSTYEKGKHHRASFKIKRSFFISKCLHILHMDLFGPVKPKTISHNKSVVISFSFGADNVVKEIYIICACLILEM